MSAPTVKAIDKQSVHQICSGQVVVTLATAVKELVENSLDAGASNIEVRLKNWGADSLEVVDNGSGVLPENLAALALKHHTSKLNVFADLVGVETFGFRGEALSSLCALGNLFISTCHKSQNIGARIEYNHDGHITKQEATARTHGTTVTLQNLFSTLPVRHKEFLRNIKREYTKMMQVLQGYCVISTGVRISCQTIGEKGKKTIALATHGNSDMRENISNVFGPKQLQTILEFKQISPSAEDCEELGLDASQIERNPVFSLTGFVSQCDHGAGRSASDRQYVYINKRPCDMPKLTRLVNEVYHVFNRNQYPFLVLHIDLSKDLVDVNVTPDKRQVFLQQEKLLLATVKSSLKAMYDPGSSNYETNQKPFTQIKLAFTKRKNNEETNATAFSKSIKDRLLLAAKVSKNKEASSILKFTTKKPNDVSRSVDDELNGTSTVNAVDDIGPGSSNGIKLNSGTLFSKSKLNTSKINEIRDAMCSTCSNELPPDSEALETSKDRSELVDDEVVAEVKQDSFSKETIKPASSDDLSTSDGHLPVNPNEYDLTSTNEAYTPEDTADKLCRKRSENDCINDTVTSSQEHCTESRDKNGNVIRCHLSRSPKQNILRSLETPSAEGHPQRQLAAKDTNQSEGELHDVEKLRDVVDSETVNKVLNVENSNESVNVYSNKTLELKRRRSSESESSENSCNTKKIRVDDGYENEQERSSRKSIAVNFDFQKLRETLVTESGSWDCGAEGTSSRYSRTFRATIAPENNQQAEEELERHITKEMFGKMEIIGQFNQGFIITKHGDDLFIIDQHASDEKYNFEDQQRNTVLKSQRLICPQSLDLTAVNENILMENLDVFRKNGFDFEINEEAPVSQRVKLVSSPVSRNWSFGKSDVDELIFMLSDSPGVNYRPSNIRKMFASRACRKSVMVGTSLNDCQMRRIVGHMGEMNHPWNCPHGRPTMRHLINLNMVRK